MVELEKPGFDTAAFLATPASGEESSNWRQRKPSFRREIPRTRFFIFRRAAQKSQLFPQPGRKLPSHFCPQVILWEKRRLRRCLDCVWPQPLPLPPALLSESAGKK